MNILQEIRNSGKKAKDLNSFAAKLFENNKPSSQEFSAAIDESKDAERGVCVEALEYLSQTKPQLIKLYLPIVIKCLDDKLPRVKWEASRVIGNVSKIFPEETGEAVSELLKSS